MKKINEVKMEAISGGGFWDGVCAAVGTVSLFSGFLALTPVGAGLLLAGEVGCIIYGVASAT